MRTLSLVLLAAACAAMIPAAAQKLEVHFLPVESMEGLYRWAQQKPAPSGVYPRAQQLAIGKKIYTPILVTGLDPSARGSLELVGDIEIVGPDGKSQAMKKCCRFSAPDRSGLRFAILSNAPSLEMDSTDPKGVYILRATVSDGRQTISGSDQIPFGVAAKAPAASKSAQPAKPAAATEPAMQSEPRERKTYPHGDRTNCLDLPTQREIIRCSEGK